MPVSNSTRRPTSTSTTSVQTTSQANVRALNVGSTNNTLVDPYNAITYSLADMAPRVERLAIKFDSAAGRSSPGLQPRGEGEAWTSTIRHRLSRRRSRRPHQLLLLLLSRSASLADRGQAAWWMKVLGGLGWLITFLAIFLTTQLVVQLALEAVGVDTTATGPTGGFRDEKNPPGQVVALLAGLAVGVLGTLLLRRWYHAEATEPTTDSPEPEPALDSDAETAR